MSYHPHLIDYFRRSNGERMERFWIYVHPYIIMTKEMSLGNQRLFVSRIKVMERAEIQAEKVVVGTTDREDMTLETAHNFAKPADLTEQSINVAEWNHLNYLKTKETLFRDILRINTYVYLAASRTLKEGT
ncbi:hypothetical protein K501DRAFT_270947 [Backusella circina FSU 941]|nr:hypothetical protein K501DRAFT_270947 [Backusella circina FSU 941]